MRKILVVEDSAIVLKVLKHLLAQQPTLQPFYADSFAAAQALVAAPDMDFFAALVDLNLPDAPDGEVVDFTLERGLPTVVLTGSFDEVRRRQLLAMGVVDYVTKEGRYSYEYAVRLLQRLLSNERVPVLVVDDSSTGRKRIGSLLRLQRFPVFEAQDGVDGIRVLLDNPGIRLVITDYNMPCMDGCEMVRLIRGKYEKSDLVIIGLSSEGEESLSAQFIKSGANDFLRKPFNQEEFFCRVSHNVEMLDMIETIRDAAHRDFYTGAYNRHYFFAQGEKLLAQAREKNVPVAVAVLNLDHFREINEQFGHEVGDQAMRETAATLLRAFGRFLLARADGQEFFALLAGLDNAKACAFVESVRLVLSGAPAQVRGRTLCVTFSAGVSNAPGHNLDQMIQNAYACLQRAKEAGGDLVFGDDI